MSDAARIDSPAQREDGWPVAPPEQQGLDPVSIAAIGPRFEKWTDATMHAVLIVRHGVLVYEHYFTGEDHRWGIGPVGPVTHDAHVKHDLRSVTKSVTSILVGIAREHGHMEDLDASVFSFFPEYDDLRTPEKETITLRHLLTMSAGLAWDELMPWNKPENSEKCMGAAPNPYRYVLEQPLVNRPGGVFNYSGGATELLGGILQKVSGTSLDKQAKVGLFDPLGIRDVQWFHYPSGDLAAASGLRLRARDLAKIGQLMLDGGAWQGKRIVSARWVEDSTTPQINENGLGGGLFFYGYQWWLGRSLLNRRETKWIAAMGYGGQRLFIVPDLNIVVVVFAGRYDSQIRIDVSTLLLNEHVLSGVLR